MKLERPLPIDGQPPRITELWVWTAIDPLTDVEGIISSRSPRGGFVMPLIGSMRSVVEGLRPYAEQVVSEAEPPRPTIQLRHFVQVED